MLYERGKVWHYDFSVAGKRYRGSTKQTDERKARKVESHLIGKAMEAGSLLPRKAPRLADFAPEFFRWLDEVVANKRRKGTTKRYYKNGWKRIQATNLPNMAIDQITRRSVEVLKLSGSPSYVNQATRTLRRMLGMAEERKLIAKAPSLPLMLETGRRTVIDGETEKALLAHAGNLMRDALPIALDTGLRPDEIARMRIEQIDWQHRTYFNASGKTPKSRRLVPLTQRVFDLLFVRCGARREGWVFASKRSKSGHVSRDGMTHAFARMRKLANLPAGVMLYAARHTFGTDAYANSGNLKAVMDSMGHSNVKTTMIYQHPELDVIREAIEKRNAERHNSRHTGEMTQ